MNCIFNNYYPDPDEDFKQILRFRLECFNKTNLNLFVKKKEDLKC